MGMFDFLFGTSEDETEQSGTSKTTGTINKADTSQKATDSTKKTGTKSDATQKETTTQNQTLLTAGQEQILNDIIKRSANRTSVYGTQAAEAAGTQQDVANTLAARSQSGVNDLDTIVRSAQDAAKLAYSEGTAGEISRYADQVGSKNNSTVQLLQQKGQRDLATQLAAVEGDIRLQGAQTLNQTGAVAADAASRASEGTRAVDLGSSQAIADALAALGVAKGARTATVGSDLTSAQQSVESVENARTRDLLSAVMAAESKEDVVSKGKTTTEKGSSLLDFLNIFAGGGGYPTPA